MNAGQYSIMNACININFAMESLVSTACSHPTCNLKREKTWKVKRRGLEGSNVKQLSNKYLTITSHLCPWGIVPRICRTILANSQNRHPMLCLPLLLAGMPISTNRIGESVSQKAMVGMFPRAASMIGCMAWMIKIKIRRQKTTMCKKTNRHNKLSDIWWISVHLVISPWISEDQKTRFTEWSLHLVSEGTRSVSSSNCMSTSVLGKFEDSSLTIGPCRLNNNILGVLNCNNNSSSQQKLFPCLPKIDDINSCAINTKKCNKKQSWTKDDQDKTKYSFSVRCITRTSTHDKHTTYIRKKVQIKNYIQQTLSTIDH